jgi:hypothetical protein
MVAAFLMSFATLDGFADFLDRVSRTMCIRTFVDSVSNIQNLTLLIFTATLLGYDYYDPILQARNLKHK